MLDFIHAHVTNTCSCGILENLHRLQNYRCFLYHPFFFIIFVRLYHLVSLPNRLELFDFCPRLSPSSSSSSSPQKSALSSVLRSHLYIGDDGVPKGPSDAARQFGDESISPGPLVLQCVSVCHVEACLKKKLQFLNVPQLFLIFRNSPVSAIINRHATIATFSCIEDVIGTLKLARY